MSEKCRYFCTGKKCWRGNNCNFTHDNRERSRYLRQQEQQTQRDFRDIEEELSDDGDDEPHGIIRCSHEWCKRRIDLYEDCWSRGDNGPICDFHCGFCNEHFNASLGGSMFGSVGYCDNDGTPICPGCNSGGEGNWEGAVEDNDWRNFDNGEDDEEIDELTRGNDDGRQDNEESYELGQIIKDGKGQKWVVDHFDNGEPYWVIYNGSEGEDEDEGLSSLSSSGNESEEYDFDYDGYKMTNMDQEDIEIVMNRYETSASRFIGTLLAMRSRTKMVRVGGVPMRPVHFTNYKSTLIAGLLEVAAEAYENDRKPTMFDLRNAIETTRGLGEGTVDIYGKDILRLMEQAYNPKPKERASWQLPPVSHNTGYVNDSTEEDEEEEDDEEDEDWSEDDAPLDEVMSESDSDGNESSEGKRDEDDAPSKLEIVKSILREVNRKIPDMQEPEYNAFGRFLMSKSDRHLRLLGNRGVGQLIRDYAGKRTFINMNSAGRGIRKRILSNKMRNTIKKRKRKRKMKMIKTMRKIMNLSKCARKKRKIKIINKLKRTMKKIRKKKVRKSKKTKTKTKNIRAKKKKTRGKKKKTRGKKKKTRGKKKKTRRKKRKKSKSR